MRVWQTCPHASCMCNCAGDAVGVQPERGMNEGTASLTRWHNRFATEMATDAITSSQSPSHAHMASSRYSYFLFRLLPIIANSRYSYFPLWLLPVPTTSRYSYFPLWLLPVPTTSRYSYFPLWLLPVTATSCSDYFPLWLLPATSTFVYRYIIILI